LLHGAATVGSVGPALTLPIFDGGRLRGELRGARADHAAAVASYDAAIVQALKEIADVLVSERAIRDEQQYTDDGVAAAHEAWESERRRYEGGLATTLEVLDAEDAWLADARIQSDLRSRAFALDVALQRALGGGYADPVAR
jgi:outer membrane protein TolC